MSLLVFTSHRVEYLSLLQQLLRNYKTLVLEEPETPELKKLLSGEMRAEEYVKWIDTPFPVYTLHLARFLVDVSRSKKIVAVEPYLQIIEGIHDAVEKGIYDEYVKNPEVQRVLRVERKATQALLEYQETFMKKDFDAAVEATIRFAKADAERFVVRDEMRMEVLSEIVRREKALIEAGQIHFLLKELGIECVNLVELASKKLGIKYIKNPGNVLTEHYIVEIVDRADEVDEELLAAQALVYITIVKKEEMLPTEEKRFPHLLDEVMCARLSRSLSYEQCRKFVERVWFR